MSFRLLQTIVFAFFICQVNSFCSKKTDNQINKLDCTSYSTPSDSYVYPILPGTSAWIALGTVDAKVKACQIPDSVTAKMSTAALIQSWLDFPFKTDIFAAPDLQTGTQYWLTNFSGLIALQKRSDAANKLLERYQTMNPHCIDNFNTNILKGAFGLSFIFVQMLLAQDIIIEYTSTPEIRKAIVSEALKKYALEKKYNNAFYYAQIDFANCLFVCGKVMKKAGYQPFINAFQTSTTLQQLLSKGYFPDGVADNNAEIQLLIQLSSDFAK